MKENVKMIEKDKKILEWAGYIQDEVNVQESCWPYDGSAYEARRLSGNIYRYAQRIIDLIEKENEEA